MAIKDDEENDDDNQMVNIKRFKYSLLFLVFVSISTLFLIKNWNIIDPLNDRTLIILNYTQNGTLPSFANTSLVLWEEIVIQDEAQPDLPGQHGKAFKVPEKQKKVDRLFKKHQFNILASDRIPFNRSIPDNRDPNCLPYKYPEKLPTTSVIIIFHNEAWSTLLRTVHSIMLRTPEALLKEIILVDDRSTKRYLKRQLEEYVSRLSSKIRVLRQGLRRGIVGARLLGAKQAKGQVLTFLDSHCEVDYGWLEPLLTRIVEDRSRIVGPVIDIIEENTFEIIAASSNIWGGFDWKLSFRWYRISERETKRRNRDDTVPIRTPTLAGGIFAVDKEYFWHIGSYDDGMKFWGAENLELSFRVWMCGGSLEIVPCSRVAHVFRRETPYTLPGGKEAVVNPNTARTADIWLDEWKMFIYTLYPRMIMKDRGESDDRWDLRHELKCNSFQWYLENVYPDSHIPLYYQYLGQVEHSKSYMCFDSSAIVSSVKPNKAELKFCSWKENHGLFWQVFLYNDRKQISWDEFCLVGTGLNEPVMLSSCKNELNEKWDYYKYNRTIIHPATGLCLDKLGSDPVPTLSPCDKKIQTQKWFMRNNFDWDPPTHKR